MSTIKLDFDSSTVSGHTSDDFTVNFPSGVQLGGRPWEVALDKAVLWNSVFNISAAYNNNTLEYSPDGGSTWKTVTFPDGAYQLEQINDYFQFKMAQNGDADLTDPNVPVYYAGFIANFSTLKARAVVSNSYQIDLTTGTLHELLGFAAIIITSTQEGANVVDITRGVNTFLINCDLVNGSYNNGLSGYVLYSFTMKVPPGAQLTVEPNEKFYLPLRDSDQISKARLYITDQMGRKVSFNGENITYSLVLRRVSQLEDLLTGFINK